MKRNRILPLLLCAVLLVCLIPAPLASAADRTGDGPLRYQSAETDLIQWASRPASARQAAGVPGATQSEVAAAQAAILRAAQDWEESVDLSAWNISLDEWDDVFFQVYFDHPELFYLYSSAQVSYYAGSNVVKDLYFQYNERYTKADQAVYDAALDEAVSACVLPGMTDPEKVAALHDWVAIHCAYDYADYRRDAYAALVDGAAVCQGYAMAFSALMQRVGIPCCYVASDAMNHGWNQVRLSGVWYHVDVTWDDNPAASQDGTSRADVPGRVTHENLLRSDTGIVNATDTAHTGWESDNDCTGTKYDSFFWTDVDSRILFPGDGTCWYMRDNVLCSNRVTGGAETRRDSSAAGSYWPVPGSASAHYAGNRSVLTGQGDRLWFTGPQAVYLYDRASGLSGTAYTYTGGRDISTAWSWRTAA